MPPSNSSRKAGPPSPPRLRSTSLPEEGGRQAVSPEPFLSGHPILPEDREYGDLTQEELHDMSQKAFEESIGLNRPLVSELEPISTLQDEYSHSPGFLVQIDALISQGYNFLIRVKGDGDCFYRALAFAYLRRLIKSPRYDKEQRLARSAEILAGAGFDVGVYEQPYEILQGLAQLHPASHLNELLEGFTDPTTSNYIVFYMRFLTSAHLRIYPPPEEFLFDPDSGKNVSVENFCERSVEPLGKEAGESIDMSLSDGQGNVEKKKKDHVQMAALAQALDVYVKVAYLDGHATDGGFRFHNVPGNAPEGTEPLVLLYRPGHYDIILQDV